MQFSVHLYTFMHVLIWWKYHFKKSTKMQVWPCWSLVHLIANLMKTCTRYVYLLQKRNFWYFGFFSAVTWLQYCRNGVKHETINQFINRFFFCLFISSRGQDCLCSAPGGRSLPGRVPEILVQQSNKPLWTFHIRRVWGQWKQLQDVTRMSKAMPMKIV